LFVIYTTCVYWPKWSTFLLPLTRNLCLAYFGLHP